jgi:hypothetical protein
VSGTNPSVQALRKSSKISIYAVLLNDQASECISALQSKPVDGIAGSVL